ncbi:tRNA lysidine(34) synthetase TilS [Candidatus Bipolaricaulota bacterium]
MIPSGARVLVAVSGGLDSVVLLDVLHLLSAELEFDVVVGHVDHGLRGFASAQDAEFVQSIATGYEREILQHHLSESNLKDHQSYGKEGAARLARLAALETLAAEAGITRIALGHTKEDQAETILYRLVRGAGPMGMRGILPVRMPFIRPLIRSVRADIHAYAVEHSLRWREDASNSDLTYARNRIRHRVLPELRKLNPRVVEALNRNANLMADQHEAVAFLMSERVNDLQIESDDPDVTLPRSEIASLPQSVLRLLLREGIQQARGSLDGIELTHIEAICQLVTSQHSHGQLSLPGLQVRMQGDILTLSPISLAPVQSWNIAIDLGENHLPNSDSTLELRVIPMADVDMEAIRSDPWLEAADADRVTLPLHLRTRVRGDRFTPLGLDQEIKLKDFLINERAPYFDRDAIPLLCDQHAIIWVAGMRLSDTVRLSDQTQRVLLMRMKGVR